MLHAVRRLTHDVQFRSVGLFSRSSTACGAGQVLQWHLCDDKIGEVGLLSQAVVSTNQRNVDMTIILMLVMIH